MIYIKDKKDCCGCHACINACPERCITMQTDEEGFLYPIVDKKNCIDCGLCEKVCPVINQNEQSKPLYVYAAKNADEKIRMQSSSGGIFTMLAEAIINEGGVVFGARFNKDWDVVHDYTETIEGVAAFRGSKYVQSTIGCTYNQAKKFLQADRKVLFSGTPCQIAGLKKYLRRNYSNLLTIDVVCHGVPSPMIWRDYLEYKRTECAVGRNTVFLSLNEMPVITGISFRDKTYGWKKFGFKISYAASKAAKNSVSKSATIWQSQEENIFLRVFFSDLCLRKSCYHCPAKSLKAMSDITIADYWGIDKVNPDFDDDKGTSLVLISSEKGMLYFSKIKCLKIETSYEDCFYRNKAIEYSAKENVNSNLFWRYFNSNGFENIQEYIESLLKPTMIEIIKRKFSTMLRLLKIN